MASLFSSSAPALRPSSSNWICHTCRRHRSSFRCTRKALRVKPDASFLPSKTEAQDHIIFNPPSSAPNVYHTPLKFLPKGDPRRKFYTASTQAQAQPQEQRESQEEQQSTLASIASTRTPHSARALPSVRPPHKKKYHLTAPEIEEMRRLRAEHPQQWTRVRLAEKFECSQFFVSLCCSSPDMAVLEEDKVERARESWGRRKREAREERGIRRELWGREA